MLQAITDVLPAGQVVGPVGDGGVAQSVTGALWSESAPKGLVAKVVSSAPHVEP
jgi:hypothetical protein